VSEDGKGHQAGEPCLKLHRTRHTYARMALASGKSGNWTVEQLWALVTHADA
jgi:hypothetical protein